MLRFALVPTWKGLVREVWSVASTTGEGRVPHRSWQHSDVKSDFGRSGGVLGSKRVKGVAVWQGGCGCSGALLTGFVGIAAM